MLEKPDLPDEKIIACLQAEYGLRSLQLDFLPLGQDLRTAVYRAVGEDGTTYFCKLRLGVFDEISVELPRFLSEQGIAQIIPPLVTKTGQLWSVLDDLHLILSPFVEGKNGYEVALSEPQWADFGAAIKRLHTVRLPLSLSRKIQRDQFSPVEREKCREIIERLDHETFDDPAAAPVVAFLHSKRDMILDLIERAGQLAQAMASRSTEFVLCHADIHPGNIFIETRGALFIVDWDRPMLAPKERDLMYIGDGQGFFSASPAEEERLFSGGYGPMQTDPIALSYYRFERNVTDIWVECTRLLSGTFGAKDSAQSFDILKWYFSPGCAVDMAYKSDITR